jgi:molybdopterin/thiamine biosynthesis adenylyltransferase
VISDGISVTFNDELLPAPHISPTQERTVHTWGKETQAMIARLRVAVAGVGSVGMAIAELLARTGIEHIGVFDFDTVEWINLDRLRGAGVLDVYLKRPKVHIAQRLLAEGSTAANPRHEFHELSICEPDGLARLLDFDLIFSCVDRPWPRHVLNTIAYADLIPVIEGGMIAFQNPNHSFRNAYWSSTVVRPGRPCLVCLRQYNPALVQVERDGSLDDPSYIANLPADSPLRRRENVAALSASVTSALLRQFISFVARPSGFGDLGPLRFNARDHKVERNPAECEEACPYPDNSGSGDARLDPTCRHYAAERARQDRASVSTKVHLGRRLDDVAMSIRERLSTAVAR